MPGLASDPFPPRKRTQAPGFVYGAALANDLRAADWLILEPGAGRCLPSSYLPSGWFQGYSRSKRTIS